MTAVVALAGQVFVDLGMGDFVSRHGWVEDQAKRIVDSAYITAAVTLNDPGSDDASGTIQNTGYIKTNATSGAIPVERLFDNWYTYELDNTDEAVATSKDIAVSDESAFLIPPTSNVIEGLVTSAWAVVRVPDGDTIHARWYIGDEAHGSQVDIDIPGDYHVQVRLPDFTYDLADRMKLRPLRLHLWGGLITMSRLSLRTRLFQIDDAVDVVDPTCTVNVSRSDDPVAPDPGVRDVVRMDAGGANHAMFEWDPFPITGELWFLESVARPARASSAANMGDTLHWVDPPGLTIDAPMYVNGTLRRWINTSGGHGLVMLGEAESHYGFHGRHNAVTLYHDARADDSPQIKTPQTWPTKMEILNSGDSVQVKGGVTLPVLYVDQFMIYKYHVPLSFASGSTALSQFEVGDTFDLAWEQLEPPSYTLGAGPNFISTYDTFTDAKDDGRYSQIDIVVYTQDGNVVFEELNIGTGTYTVDTALTGSGTDMRAFIKAHFDDGTGYAWIGWRFNVGSDQPQIYRRL